MPKRILTRAAAHPGADEGTTEELSDAQLAQQDKVDNLIVELINNLRPDGVSEFKYNGEYVAPIRDAVVGAVARIFEIDELSIYAGIDIVPDYDPLSLSAVERKIYNGMGKRPCTKRGTARATGISEHDTMVGLLMLEIKGLVRMTPNERRGMLYTRVNP